MKKEQLSDVIGNLSDDLLSEAKRKPEKKARRRYPIWVGSAAAVLAVVFFITGVLGNSTPTAAASCLASPEYPSATDNQIRDKIRTLFSEGAGLDFYKESSKIVLGNTEGKNVVYSPLNLYFALSMLAECAEGESRQQILDALGTESVDALRETVNTFWKASFENDEYGRATLANSVWLSDKTFYIADTVKRLADDYFASAYMGKMGSKELDKALQEWLDKETDGLLKEQVKNVETDELTLVMLASTLYYRSRWTYEFSPNDNTEGTFHGADGDENATFLNKNSDEVYYYGDNFGAIALPQSNGGSVWLILPDEGISAEELARQGLPLEIVNTIGMGDGIESTYCKVNFSMPKTDIHSGLNLIDALKEMGVSDVFDKETANLYGLLLEDCDAWVDVVKQEARLAMDEQGVTAAAFTVETLCGAAIPKDTVDFILDRPFLVVVTNPYNLPVMTAIVNSVA